MRRFRKIQLRPSVDAKVAARETVLSGRAGSYPALWKGRHDDPRRALRPLFLRPAECRVDHRPATHLPRARDTRGMADRRSEEHASELQSLMRISYAVFCLKKKKKTTTKIE